MEASTFNQLFFFRAKILLQVYILNVFLFWQCPTSSTPTNMVLDLNSNTSVYFKNQIRTWINPSDYYECEDRLPKLRILSPVVKRTYDFLPPHQSVYITMSLSFLGSWLPGDNLQIKVIDKNDSVLQEQNVRSLIPSDIWPDRKCGYNSTSDVLTSIEINHTTDVLKLEFYFSHQEVAFVGIRDIKILLAQNNMKSPNFCLPTSHLVASNNHCLCPSNQYHDSVSGTCEACHNNCGTCFNQSELGCLSCAPGYSYNGTACIMCDSSCQTCFGSDASNCLSCFDGDYFSFDKSTCVKDSCPTPLALFPLSNYFYCRCPLSSQYYYERNNTCNVKCPTSSFNIEYKNLSSFCTFKCLPNQYYYKNGSCGNQCETDFKLRDEGGYQYCDFLCSNNQYLYWDKSCLSSCSFPLKAVTISGNRYCSYPCQSHEYLYWNGVCKSACNFPLQPKSKKGKNFCNYPCRSNYYLYWNGSCLNTCGFPYKFKSEDNSKYCNLPCPNSFFLFINGSCINSCQPPLVKRFESAVDFCDRPCPSSNPYYYPDEKACRISCPQPYVLNDTDLSFSCILPLSAEQKKQVESVNSFNSGASDATQGVVSVSVIASADAGGMSIAGLSKILQYTKFINTTHSAKLELMFKSKNLTTGFIPFLPRASNNILQAFGGSEVPFIFAKYHIHSSFFVNFWDGALSLAIISALTIGIKMMEFLAGILKSRFFPHKIILVVRNTIQNLLFTQFYNSYGDIMMLSALEIRINRLDYLTSAISFTISTLLVGLGLGVIYLHLSVLKRYQEVKIQDILDSRRLKKNTSKRETSQALKNFEQKYQGMKVFFLNYKDISLIHQAFFLLLNIRNAMFSLVIGFLFDYPLFQACFLTFFTLITVIYLFIKKPFKSILNLAQQMSGEIILLTVNGCLIGLASLDIQGSNNMDIRESMSQIIIYCNIVLGLVAPVFTVLKIIGIVFDLIRNKLRNKQKEVIYIETDEVNYTREIMSADKIQNKNKTTKADRVTQNGLSINIQHSELKILSNLTVKEGKTILIPENRLSMDNLTSFKKALRLKRFYQNNLHDKQKKLRNNLQLQSLEEKDENSNNTFYKQYLDDKDPNKSLKGLRNCANSTLKKELTLTGPELSKLKRINFK